MTLYPYNMYILAAAAVITLIVLGTVGKSALAAIKSLKSLPLDQVQTLLASVKKKANVSGTVLKKTASGLKTILAVGIILQALKKYSDDNERSTVKRYGKAASALVKDTRSNIKVIEAIRKTV